MQRRRTAGLVVAPFLIASAATADAECAWLLWAGAMTDSVGSLGWRAPSQFAVEIEP